MPKAKLTNWKRTLVKNSFTVGEKDGLKRSSFLFCHVGIDYDSDRRMIPELRLRKGKPRVVAHKISISGPSNFKHGVDKFEGFNSFNVINSF